MQKTLDILEKNVQWIALALGGVFLLWSVYSYVVTPPATVAVNGKSIGTGEMSPTTEEGPAKNVQTAMNDNTGIQIAQMNVAQSFHQAMVSPAAPGIPQYVFGWPSKTSVNGKGPDQTGNPNDTRIATVPKLPPAQVVTAQTGLSVVNEPDNNANPNQPNRNAAAVQQVVKTDDLAWVGMFWKISADQLKKAFEAPLGGRQMDPQFYNTTVLEVEVQRQQAQGFDASGQPIWPKDDQFQKIPAIKLYQKEVRAMPADSASTNQKFEYADWAEKNPQFVYTPEFYQVSGGAPPPDLNAIYTPANGAAGNGAAGAADNGAPDNATQPAPDATTQPGAAPAGAQQKAKPAAGTQPSVRANPEPFYLLQDNSRPGNNYDSYYRRVLGRRRPIPPPGPTGSPQRPGFPPAPAPGPGFNQNFAAGEGKIDPLNMTDDLKIWAYDDSAKPGQTYRYRVVYKLRNPVFGTANVADPKLSAQLAITSPPSDWTGPVTVPEKTKFWIATLGTNKVNLDVFQWEKGEWKKLPSKEAALSPGDLVPGTDWTVVDVRGEGGRERDKYVLLTNDTGQMSKRDISTDHSDPTHKDLVDQANNPNGSNTTGTTPTGNTPPPASVTSSLRGRSIAPQRGR